MQHEQNPAIRARSGQDGDCLLGITPLGRNDGLARCFEYGHSRNSNYHVCNVNSGRHVVWRGGVGACCRLSIVLEPDAGDS